MKKIKKDDDLEKLCISSVLGIIEKYVLENPPERFDHFFFEKKNPIEISKLLLHSLIWTKLSASNTGEPVITVGRISECEAYVAPEDEASHAYGMKKTKRNAPMYGKGGTVYVYLCYGMHYLMNISTNVEGIPHAVLFRSITPIAGLKHIFQRRQMPIQNYSDITMNKLISIGRGPSCLSKCLGIDISLNFENVTESSKIWITKKVPYESLLCYLKEHLSSELLSFISSKESNILQKYFYFKSEDNTYNDIVESQRIGIDSVSQAAQELKYRFYLSFDKSVSKAPTKKAKKLTKSNNKHKKQKQISD